MAKPALKQLGGNKILTVYHVNEEGLKEFTQGHMLSKEE
jgi:hypothetical protein